MRLLFERGKFGPEATLRVAIALRCLAPGLLMFSMNNILARAFFALRDIKTPMKISVFCLALNLVFAFMFMRHAAQWHLGGEAGLGTANTLSAGFNLGLLGYALRRKLSRLDLGDLKRTLGLLTGAAAAAGIVAAGLGTIWEHHLGHTNLPLKLGAVFVPGTIAGVVYWVAAYAMKVPAATEMADLILLRLRRNRGAA